MPAFHWRVLLLQFFTGSLLLVTLSIFLLLAVSPLLAAEENHLRSFHATGVVQEISPEHRSLVIAHDAITNYMQAMVMPFKVRNTAEIEGLQAGNRISFLLHVTDTESWVDHISRSHQQTPAENQPSPASLAANPAPRAHHPLMDFLFTNELGQAVSLSQYKGQALAITFFFTRCPIPEFCPRLSKNFQEALRKLSSLPQAPTNWHFLSVTFDPEFDTPPVLKNYAETYQYDPKHWTFLTGPVDKIHELAGQSDVSFQRDTGLFNHNFRTLIIDATGRLQMVFPTSGDLSDAITSEILKAAAITNRSS
jgi:protein SCO1/2